MKPLVARFACLLFIPVVVGLLFNSLRANSLEIFREPVTNPVPPKAGAGDPSVSPISDEVTIDEIDSAIRDGTALIIDARKRSKYVAGHLVSAISVPSTEIFNVETINKVKSLISPADDVIIYCDGKDCNASKDVREFLIGLNYPAANLRIFKQGWMVLSELPLPKAQGADE